MRRIALLALVALALPAALNAQARLMVGGGISNPLGDFADAVDAGKHGRVGLQVGVPVFPVSVRAEGEVHSFSEATGKVTPRSNARLAMNASSREPSR